MPLTPLPYGLHQIDESDIEAVNVVLRSDWLTTGPKVAGFEKALGDYTGARHVVAVNSGTSGLDIAVGALNLPAGSEIITTPFTFVASSNAILYNNCKPVLADIDPKTYIIDPEQVRKKITPKTKAIIFVDYAGQPAEIEAMQAIAQEHKLALIEDAAHSLGAEYRGRRIGTQADMTVFSFHPVKHITTGEGGAVATENDGYHARLRALRNHGIDKTPGERAGYQYDMQYLGRNYRITDFQCALGISQLQKLPRFLERREELVRLYQEALSGIPGLGLPYVRPEVRPAWHLYTILLDPRYSRDRVFQKMREAGIGVNVHYIPFYRFTYYRQHFNLRPEDYPVTENIFSRILTLPLHPRMENGDIARVADALKSSLEGA